VSFSCGIVGLPNAGKSTLFNALTRAHAEVAGYPFTTLERNVGITMLPDPRLLMARRFGGSARATPTSIRVVDIAGLVRGASRGEGLGNKFLGHIRDVDGILHVVRCFDHPAAPHILGHADPTRDVSIVETELILADLAALDRRRAKITAQARAGEPLARRELGTLDELGAALDRGQPARAAGLPEPVCGLARELNLLTVKPVVYVANVPDPDQADSRSGSWLAELQELGASQRSPVVPVQARVLADLGEMEEADRAELAGALGASEDQLKELIQAAYRALDLITFFTANKNEARAWTLGQGSTAMAAAGKVHTDFARGFIAAEVLAQEDLEAGLTPADAQRLGRVRLEGREYVVRDGDLLEFRFSI